ncbi:MAG TPA: hypothetical protein VIZ18_17135 [Ktedonobacteraceae bacterium]
MTDTPYTPPVDKLLTYGKPEPLDSEDWPDYLEIGLGPEHIPELLRMAADKALLEGDEESSEAWGPVHAVRALGQLRSESVVGPLLSLFDDEFRDDWVSDELPMALGMFGPAIIPAISAYVADTSRGLFPRVFAASTFKRISENFPESRPDCIAAYVKQLQLFEQEDEELNALLISDLADMKAMEALPLIERAFAADRVDTSIVELDDVYVDLGLKEREEKPPLSLEELINSFTNFPASKFSPSDFEIVPPDFPGDENAPIVDSLPVQASRPVREFKPIKISRNKAKKKKRKRH